MSEVRKWYQITPDMLATGRQQASHEQLQSLEKPLKNVLSEYVTGMYGLDAQNMEGHSLDALLCLVLLGEHPHLMNEKHVGAAADILNVPGLIEVNRRGLLNTLADAIVYARDQHLGSGDEGKII